MTQRSRSQIIQPGRLMRGGRRMLLGNNMRGPGSSAPATDPNFASVVLLVGNDNGADGSTSITDKAPSPHALTIVGTTQWDNAQAPSGLSTSLLFDGAGSWITTPDSADWTFGAGDFTIDGYCRLVSADAGNHIVSKWSPASGVGSFALLFPGSTSPRFYWNYGATFENRFIASASAWALNTWHHFAVVRNGGTLTMYKSGTAVASDATLGTNALLDSTDLLIVGAASNLSTTDDWNGWLGPVRITKGVARWTTDFTPPSLPYPMS